MNDAEKLELALWALHGNQYWLGSTIDPHRQRGMYVAIYQPGPYSGPEPVQGTVSDDPWECMKLARLHFDPPQSETGGKLVVSPTVKRIAEEVGYTDLIENKLIPETEVVK